MKIKCLMFTLLIFTFLFSDVGVALTGLEIMGRVDKQFEVNDEYNFLIMRLISKHGDVRERKMERYAKRENNGRDKVLIKFTFPFDVRDVALLTIENLENSIDDQWLYLPALKKTQRITAGKKKDNFMGSDFYYEDIESEDLSRYDYKLLRTELMNSQECFLVEAKAKDPKSQKESAYSKRLFWVTKDSSVIILAEFYNKKGKLIKVEESRGLKKIIDGYWRATYIEMRNVINGHKTILLVKNTVINGGLSNKYFNPNFLSRKM